ncbi:MAG: FHA domain-containing protein, partial [Pseudomonadota bacterium]
MPLILRIENLDSLPDGGPITYEVDRKGLDIGRDSYLDWTLPDTQRFISGKHCEIHYRDAGYWLHDVSTNGTSVNGLPGRLTGPHKLNNGDRIHIGQYIIVAQITDEDVAPAAVSVSGGAAPASSDPWGDVDGAAEAIDKRAFDSSVQSASAGRSPFDVSGDLAEENISWGVGAPSSPPPSDDIDVSWATGPSTPPSSPSSPPPSTPPSAPPSTRQDTPPSAPSESIWGADAPPEPAQPDRASAPPPGPAPATPDPFAGSANPPPASPAAPHAAPDPFGGAPTASPDAGEDSGNLGGQWIDGDPGSVAATPVATSPAATTPAATPSAATPSATP